MKNSPVSLLNVQEVKDVFHWINDETVYRHVRAGDLPFVEHNGKMMFTSEDVEALDLLLKERRREALKSILEINIYLDNLRD